MERRLLGYVAFRTNYLNNLMAIDKYHLRTNEVFENLWILIKYIPVIVFIYKPYNYRIKSVVKLTKINDVM